MSPSDDEGHADRLEPFGDRVAWAPSSAGGFAYVPGRVLVRGKAAAAHLDLITGADHDPQPLGEREGAPEATWYRVDGIDDPLAVVALMRADGFAAEPDHVLFAHGGCCCEPHPADGWGCLTGDPYRANPYRANPYRANPYRANPYRANPYRANPYRANEAHGSSAVPARGRTWLARTTGYGARITVLDTGLAADAQRPALLPTDRITGAVDLPEQARNDPAATSGTLDPVAGHGTFIAGVIEQLAPGCTIHVEHVVSPDGDTDVSTVAKMLNAIAAGGDLPDFLSLSFGGTAAERPLALAGAIARVQLHGVVVVASAGNDGSCEPQYPAALDGVVAVGALGPDGPAPWTNYGPWVDACAPGTDLVSAFFADFDGPQPPVGADDPDRFREWAIWSGTSFATPVVVAALARELASGAADPRAAVERLIHSPAAVGIPNLGTVVTA
jgi:hypothetical protein